MSTWNLPWVKFPERQTVLFQFLTTQKERERERVSPGIAVSWVAKSFILFCCNSTQPITFPVKTNLTYLWYKNAVVCSRVHMWKPNGCRKMQIEFMVSLKAISELFPELFKLCLYDIHIESYDYMMSSSWDIIHGNIGLSLWSHLKAISEWALSRTF